MPDQKAKECGRDHGFNARPDEQDKKDKKVTDAELNAIIDRLYKTQTKHEKSAADSSNNEQKDANSKTEKDVDAIVERLYNTKTKAMQDNESERAKAEDEISKKKVTSGDVDGIVERLYTTHTQSSSADNKAQKVNTNSIARTPATEEEIKEIYARLLKAHTKASEGATQCKTVEPSKTPGLGQKMLPIIEGIETRFMGKSLTEAQATEIMKRMMSTQTGASQSRKDFPKVLLYPERTILHNNFDRIRAYQDSGAMTRQKELARREKWFN